jgi:uridine kinase
VTSRVSPGSVGRTVVAVDGLDGSGKSQLAARLAGACRAAGAEVVTLSVDDFRRPVSFGDVPRPDEEEVYYQRYYDFAAFDGCLRAFLNGEEAAVVPRFDGASARLEGELTFRFAGAGLAVVDGVFLRRAPVVAAGETILLTVSPDEARRRILDRDRKKGRSDQEILRRIDRRYFPGQERYRREHDPLGRAAVVIDNDDWQRPRLVRRRPAFPPVVERALDDLLATPPG